MSDQTDIHEPEHDHLLDHEFYGEDEEEGDLEDLDPVDQEDLDDHIEWLNDR
ncbi:hypothetical protein [Pseudomonas akapageensis]|uniref:hypothetical protein n=1 Tax=Pseudomonas akapageensis TaxID=2609961 RepID=UPI00140CBEBC|nr:hypothetical protein [Pseudomonas akapageensis]